MQDSELTALEARLRTMLSVDSLDMDGIKPSNTCTKAADALRDLRAELERVNQEYDKSLDESQNSFDHVNTVCESYKTECDALRAELEHRLKYGEQWYRLCLEAQAERDSLRASLAARGEK